MEKKSIVYNYHIFSFLLLKIDIFDTIHSDYGFPFLNSSKILPTFLPICIHTHFLSLTRKQPGN